MQSKVEFKCILEQISDCPPKRNPSLYPPPAIRCLIKSSSKSTSTRKTSTSSSRSETKFIPNLIQLNSATKELPEPDIWPEKTFHCPIEVDGKQRIISFALQTITREKSRRPAGSTKEKSSSETGISPAILANLNSTTTRPATKLTGPISFSSLVPTAPGSSLC